MNIKLFNDWAELVSQFTRQQQKINSWLIIWNLILTIILVLVMLLQFS